MITRQMNTQRKSEFHAQVSAACPKESIVMVVDGASSHVSKDLVVPKSVHLLKLQPYAPEVNPQEHIWDQLREKAFPNSVFNDLEGVRAQLDRHLPELAANRMAVRNITAWPWIVKLNLNAH